MVQRRRATWKPEHLTGHGKKMAASHIQKGGSWGSFWSGVKGLAKSGYEKYLKPAWQYVKEKPLSAAAKGLRYIGQDKAADLAQKGADYLGKGRKKKAVKQTGSGKKKAGGGDF